MQLDNHDKHARTQRTAHQFGRADSAHAIELIDETLWTHAAIDRLAICKCKLRGVSMPRESINLVLQQVLVLLRRSRKIETDMFNGSYTLIVCIIIVGDLFFNNYEGYLLASVIPHSQGDPCTTVAPHVSKCLMYV